MASASMRLREESCNERPLCHRLRLDQIRDNERLDLSADAAERRSIGEESVDAGIEIGTDLGDRTRLVVCARVAALPQALRLEMIFRPERVRVQFQPRRMRITHQRRRLSKRAVGPERNDRADVRADRIRFGGFTTIIKVIGRV